MRVGSVVVVVLAALTGACASTGARPRPFPTPAVRQPASPPPAVAAMPEPPPTTPAPLAAEEPAEPAAATPLAIERAALTSTALMLRGAPYRNGGTDPTGFDC